ncbi:low molecular weight phosphotyrosine protein phosphatase 1-like [Argopecten irradians]|uniref:low molecular weight phosphotyrosine protein phosphatase 1-like n=1 Tax=Argopecten irradians TaxID=31199 RepID=UPI00371EB5CF
MAGAESGAVKSVLFICLENICLSPIAEAVFLDLLKKKGELEQWRVDSAALGDYYTGDSLDERVVETLKKKGIENYSHVVRQITDEDFRDFEIIIALQEKDVDHLMDIEPKGSTAGISMLGDFDTVGGPTINDPYYNADIKEFEDLIEKVMRCCEEYLKCEKL